MSQEEIKDEALEDDGASPEPVEKVSGASVCYLGDIEIHSGKPLPQYDSGEVRAYAANGKKDKNSQFVVLVCERHLTPRIKSIEKYTSIIDLSLVAIETTGVVRWPLTKKEHYVFVYKNNLGESLLGVGATPALSMKQEEVMETVLRPLSGVLLDLRNRGLFHGAIRPDNMYRGLSTEMTRVILGDCLSSPASAAQPVLYEPIDRAMASPLGRGVGTIADDLYALGITISVLMRSRDPLEGLSDAEIIGEKMLNGSYLAVTGKDRFTGSILELLRGLLQDDISQRWDIDEVMVWLEGRRVASKQGVRHKKAARPFELAEEKFLQTPLLMMGFSSHPEEAHKMIEEGHLEQWLRRSLDDMSLVEKLREAVGKASDRERGKSYPSLLLSYVSSALDASAPIRFNGLTMMGEAVGYLLASYIEKKVDVQVFSDVFLKGVALNWAGSYEGAGQDLLGLLSKFDNCSNFVKQSKPGYGIERCLYYLNSETHCLAEKLDKYFVRSPEDFALACEDMSKKGKAPAFFLDRHSAAFLLVKDSRVIERSLYDLSTSDEGRRVMGNLRCLAAIQKRSKVGYLPAVAKALIGMLPCVYDRFHDADFRTKIQTSVEKAASKGDLVQMVDLLDNVETADMDSRAFRAAMLEYTQLRSESKALDAGLANKPLFGRKTGGDVAAIFSGFVAAIFTLGMFFLYMK